MSLIRMSKQNGPAFSLAGPLGFEAILFGKMIIE
jgi:hypothetical protein